MADNSGVKGGLETSKKVAGLSSRLMQNTAASSAKCTPTLTRKFGSLNSRQTPTGKIARNSTFGSGRKENRSFKANQDSAKKVVLNSTAENENVVPDWDASAIAPPNKDDGSLVSQKLGSNPILASQMGTSSFKPKSSASTAMKPRGPFRALPTQTASKPLNSVFKRLQSSSSDGSSSLLEDEDQALYDEYLLSSLMCVNVKKNCQDAIKAANKELVDLYSATEKIRSQVVAQEKANAEMIQLIKFHKEAGENHEKLKLTLDAMKQLKSEVKQVATALESCTHNLPVHGAKVDNIEPVLKSNFAGVSKLGERAQANSSLEFLDIMEKLLRSLDLSKSSAESCKKSLKELKSEALNEASMKLSLLQAQNNEDLTEGLLPMPPEPKLVDF